MTHHITFLQFVKRFNGKFQSGSITIVITIVKRTMGGNIKGSISLNDRPDLVRDLKDLWRKYKDDDKEANTS